MGVHRIAVLALLAATVALAGCNHGFVWPEPRPHDCTDSQESGLACTTLWEGFDSPAQVVSWAGRLFVVEQTGKVWLFDEDLVDVRLFLDVSGKVATCHYEQGLLGLAFPAPATSGAAADGGVDPDVPFYVTYTEKASCSKRGTWGKGDLLLWRFEQDGERATPGSGKLLLRVPEPYRNHNGGHIAFGPDGMLYLGVGDGGDHGDPLRTGRDASDLLGSILRLDVSGAGEQAQAPADNPFGGDAAKDARVLHYGLRNPWRFAFADDGALWIADVGQDCFEEVNQAPVGAGGLDFGWSAHEAGHPYTKGGSCPQGPGATGSGLLADGTMAPVWSYGRQDGHCSVVGGPVLPDAEPWVSMGLAGGYVVGDFCSGHLWALLPAAGSEAGAAPLEARLLLETGLQITAMALHGEDLIVGHWNGSIHRIGPLSLEGAPET